MPDVNEAFAASFRFVTTGTQSTPVAQRGLTPPANWGSGLKSTNFKWYIRLPNSSPNGPMWSTQASDPLNVGAANANANQFRANGNPLTVNVIGYNSSSRITNAEVQISAFTTADNTSSGTPSYIDAPFSGYVWSLWDSGATPAAIPSPKGNMTVFDNSGPFTLSFAADPDENGVALYQYPLISLAFKPNLRGIIASNDRRKLFIDIALYFSLDGAQCYDDPEMEIDLGS